MKPIKRSYTTIRKTRYRKSFTNKSADLLEKSQTEKPSREKLKASKINKKKGSHPKKPISERVQKDITTSSLKYFFSPVKMASDEQGSVVAKKNINNIPDAITAADLKHTIFIVLDSLDDNHDPKQSARSRPSKRNVKPSPRKVSTRRKGNLKKKPIFCEKSRPSDKRKESINEGNNLSKNRTQTVKTERGLAGSKCYRQHAAGGDGGKKDRKYQNERNSEIDNANDRSETEHIAENRCLMTAYENISTTFLDICLPFTFAGQHSPEEDVSKVDGKFIQSLMKIAKAGGQTGTRKAKPLKSENVKKDTDESSCEDPGTKQRLRKNKTENLKLKKRLYQTQNIFFRSEIESEFHSKEKPEIKDLTPAEKNNSLQSSSSRKSKFEEVQLLHIKSEKIKRKYAKEPDKKNRKSRGKSSIKKDVDVVEIPLNDDGSKVTEIWRNEARVASENSLSSQSATSVNDKIESDYPPDFEMKSYRALQKIVEEEVQRIYQSRQATEEKKENETVEADPSAKIEGNASRTKPEEEKQDSSPKSKPRPESKKEEIKLYQKLTIPATKNFLNGYYLEDNKKVFSHTHEATAEKQDKLDELKTKLTMLAQETNDTMGKIPEDIIKNWSIIKRLEKAFLALGTPIFPNKNTKNSIGALPQARMKDATRKTFQQEKTRRSKIRNTTSPEHLQKSQIPVLATPKYDPFNRTGYDRADRIESTRRLSRTDDFGNSDIYFFSFEPTCHQRKMHAEPQTSTEGLESKRFNKIPVQERDFLGKCEGQGGINTKVFEEEPNRNITNPSKEISPPMQWLQSMNGGKGKGSSKLLPRPKPQVLETKFMRKTNNQCVRNHSTHTIFPTFNDNKTHILLKKSSSRTYVIDSDDDVGGKEEQPTSLERKGTFDVIPGKNALLMKSISYTKTDPNDLTYIKNGIMQRGSTDFNNKINKSKTVVNREVLKKSQSPPQLHKSCIPKRPSNTMEKVRNIEQYEGEKKSNLETSRKNFCVIENKKIKGQQLEGDKNFVPWVDVADISNKLSVQPLQSEDETLKIDLQCQVNESTLTMSIDNGQEPLRVIVCKDFEPEVTSQKESYDSSISTNTYDVSDGLILDGGSKVLKPLSCNSSLSKMSTSTFRVIPVRREARRKTERCLWEQDIKQYREIVKDIMSQYQRTNGFLKQSQQIKVKTDSQNFGSGRSSVVDERDRNFAGQIGNIAEYRRKIMSEYNAVPLVEYKSKILENRHGSAKQHNYFLQRNLLVANNVGEDIDSDVKDYQPNVHKILDSQLYVDTRNLGKRIKGNGKFAEKVISLQDTIHLRQSEYQNTGTRKTTGSQSLRQIENPSIPVIRREPETENILGETSAINSLTSVSDNQSVHLDRGSPIL